MLNVKQSSSNQNWAMPWTLGIRAVAALGIYLFFRYARSDTGKPSDMRQDGIELSERRKQNPSPNAEAVSKVATRVLGSPRTSSTLFPQRFLDRTEIRECFDEETIRGDGHCCYRSIAHGIIDLYEQGELDVDNLWEKADAVQTKMMRCTQGAVGTVIPGRWPEKVLQEQEVRELVESIKKGKHCSSEMVRILRRFDSRDSECRAKVFEERLKSLTHPDQIAGTQKEVALWRNRSKGVLSEEWGDTYTTNLAATLFGVNFIVYSVDMYQWCPAETETEKTVALRHIGGHYNLLKPKK